MKVNAPMSDHQSNVRSKRVIAEVISIGDEITTGAILDTNAPYISQSLSEIGVRTLYHTTISDDIETMVAAFAIACRRADVVICTGGLGPTQDDLTRQAVANLLGVQLYFDKTSFEHITQLFTRRGRTVPESNKTQALFPLGSQIIHNANGTAPGFFIESRRERLQSCSIPFATFKSGYRHSEEFILLAFPGVPAELYEMWKGVNGRAAIERFIDRTHVDHRTVYRAKRIHSFGVGESSVESMLPGLIDRNHFPTVGITAKNSVITLRIFAEGNTESECEQQIDDISRVIYTNVGDFVFGEDDDTLSSVLCHNLRAQCQKVGIFEWGTQGLLSKTLESDVLGFGRTFGESGNSLFYKLFGDSSTISDSQKKKRESIESFSSSFYVDNLVVPEELVKWIQKETCGAPIDYFLAIGPYPASYSQGNPDSVVGNVDVILIDFRDSLTPTMRREVFLYGGEPSMVDALFCNRALDLLLKHQ